MDQRTCPTGYILDIITNNCVPKPGSGPGKPTAPTGPSNLPTCTKLGQKNCVPKPTTGPSKLPTCKKAGEKNCVPKPSGPTGSNKLPTCKKAGEKNCVPKPSGPTTSCRGNQVSQNGKCVNVCVSNNRPGFMNGGSCQAFNNSTSGGANNPLLNRPLTSNCNTATQYQDKSGKCLDLCVVNNVPGALRDGKCRKFSDTMLGSGNDQGPSGSGPGGKPSIKPPTRKPGPSSSGPCPPGQKPSATNSKVCVVDLEYNPSTVTCPPGQVFENGTCKVPQQGPPPPQKPISFVPNIPQSGCQPGQTCAGSVNFQGTNLNAYSYNGNTYIIKVVDGKPQPCMYKPGMNANGGFPCLDDTTVNFVNGQIQPNNGFENAFSR